MEFVSAGGAKSSQQKPRFDLIERALLVRLAERMTHGLKHGERNYRLGAGDPAYRIDRINHLLDHAHKYAEAETPAEKRLQLSAIAANCNILAYLDDAEPAVSDSRIPNTRSGCVCARSGNGRCLNCGEPV